MKIKEEGIDISINIGYNKLMSVEYIKTYGRHHAFFLSEYHGEDRNGEWNLCSPNEYDHECITNGGNDMEIARGKMLDEKYKRLALSKYTGKHRDVIIKIMKRKKYAI